MKLKWNNKRLTADNRQQMELCKSAVCITNRMRCWRYADRCIDFIRTLIRACYTLSSLRAQRSHAAISYRSTLDTDPFVYNISLLTLACVQMYVVCLAAQLAASCLCSFATRQFSPGRRDRKFCRRVKTLPMDGGKNTFSANVDARGRYGWLCFDLFRKDQVRFTQCDGSLHRHVRVSIDWKWKCKGNDMI